MTINFWCARVTMNEGSNTRGLKVVFKRFNVIIIWREEMVSIMLSLCKEHTKVEVQVL